MAMNLTIIKNSRIYTSTIHFKKEHIFKINFFRQKSNLKANSQFITSSRRINPWDRFAIYYNCIQLVLNTYWLKNFKSYPFLITFSFCNHSDRAYCIFSSYH